MIKFVDLAAQNLEIRERVEREFAAIHEKTAYIGGPQVASFEHEFADFLGARRVVGVGSGTDALRLVLLAMGVGPGDEVITTPMTFIATAEAIVQVGALPVFADIDPVSYNLSPAAVQKYLKARRWSAKNGPRVLMPVHLYGLPAAMDAMREIAAAHHLRIVEDACQAHGARLRTAQGWVKAGTVSEAGCFSFYPGKNLGAWGEAGAVATDDEELANRVAVLRDHGRMSHYGHSDYGYNARLDAVQAAVLRAKLERLADWNARRRTIASMYRELLADSGVDVPIEPEGYESCYHLFVIRTPGRDVIREALTRAGIESGVHYPVPLHMQPACAQLGYRPGDFPNAERLAATALSLPMHPHLSDEQVVQIAAVVREAAKEARAAA